MTKKMPSILFAEDELPLAEIIRECLESRGFEVAHYATATSALEHYYQHKPELIILDIMLPDADGFAIARQVRNADMDTPIIFLTSRSLPQDVVEGFESGGNDYLKKPFSMEELVVRIKALLNKNRTLFTDTNGIAIMIPVGIKYTFNYKSSILLLEGKPISLTARESELLKLFLLNKNQVMDRKSILMHIWGNDDFFSGRSLDVFITKLRKHLKEDPAVRIMNVRGVGYKLIV